MFPEDTLNDPPPSVRIGSWVIAGGAITRWSPVGKTPPHLKILRRPESGRDPFFFLFGMSTKKRRGLGPIAADPELLAGGVDPFFQGVSPRGSTVL